MTTQPATDPATLFATKLDPDTVRAVETALRELAQTLAEEGADPALPFLKKLHAQVEARTLAFLSEGGLRAFLKRIDPGLT